MRFDIEPPSDYRGCQTSYIVQGTVFREGDRVRISVQLIHAQTDQPLWAESYDREVQTLPVTNQVIARAIISQIEVLLIPGKDFAARWEALDLNPDR